VRDGTGAAASRRLLLLTAPEDEVLADALRVRNNALLACAGIVLAMIPVAFFLAQLISTQLRNLRSEALALRNLDFTERPLHGSYITEIDEFSQTFGTMRSHIRAHNEAATHFVPREFLEQLGRPDLRSLQLGDHREAVMTLLFSDIRSFTTLSGQMTPEETFRFVNSYLTQIGPLIREKTGFIDKYIGDAIFALFPGSTADAVDAAIAMQRQVVAYNQGRARAGYAPITIGIGLHRGPLMLGTIGEALRFETTVISDAVNIASRMEGLTKTFGSLILASGDVIAEVAQAEYRTRRLGDVLLKGAVRPVTVYEICDADAPELLAHKLRTLDAFEAARIAYARGDFDDAYARFDQIALDERDLPAAYYRDRSAVMRSVGIPGAWYGIEPIETK
jgi:two-component system sensor histidine kinase ChiS